MHTQTDNQLNNSKSQFFIRGQTYTFQGNEPILLDDPSRVWLIQSGSMALFAVKVKDGVIEGTRRYLFSINEGYALFGTSNSAIDQQHQILAVPIGEIELLQIHQECFRELVANADTRERAITSLPHTWIENWLLEFSSVLSHVTIPTIEVKPGEETRFSLLDGQTFQPESGAICWVQIQQGSVGFLGLEEQNLTTATGYFPLTDKMWLEAMEGVQLTTQTTSQFWNSDHLLAGLSQIHIQLLHSVDFLDRQEAQDEIMRLRDRHRLNRQVTSESLGELASTIGSQESNFFLEGTPLLVAAGAVGKALGVTIRPPTRSENLQRVKEPLEAIVRASRLRMRQVLLRDNWWEKDCGPLVAYTELDNRPVAILPVSPTSYEIFDPIEHTRIKVDESIAETIASVAYMFYRSFPDQVLKSSDILSFALKGRGRDILLTLLTGVAVTVLGMLSPQATAIIMDNAIPDSDRGLLLQIGMGLLVAALSTVVFQLAQGFALLRIETGVSTSTEVAVWDRLLNLPVSFFRQYTTGDLHSRASSIGQISHHLSANTIIKFITSFFALFYLVQLFYYNFKLALLAVAVAIVSSVVTMVSGLLMVKKVRPLLELQGKIFGQTVQIINGISKLHIAGAEERAFASWSKNYTRQLKLTLSTQQIEDAVVIFNTLMPTLTSGVLYWLTINQFKEAQTSGAMVITIGTFLAFNAAFGEFVGGTTKLSNIVTEIVQITPHWKRTQPILQAIPEVDLSKADPGKLIGKILVDRITFRYRSDGPLILDDVSISAEPGKLIALVGGSGSGKSTIFRLLLGFEAPESGSIYYDGQDISGLDVDALRRQLGVVLQNGRLNAGSIFENIAGGANITFDEAWEAARMSGFAEDVAAMPMEMHTVVSEGGSNLSGGQRQRLLIARALVLKPRILLFDEATSALDNRTQAIVSESLDKIQVTRIVIAHRLSTIRNAHLIYVLQAGKIVQQGSFAELAAVEGLFAQLMARQMA
ncbi:NHLP bacteriocin export ABC transporter permease/ATPase subunit [Cylindrospermum sp. FACHB-282]|uniref:NHLP bacteriocin export ABC transporter permease/ATPase subunit n=1 Tax=Cylindrospermum sp. FACHB-282 TaxID=2692794 RepID=UPI00168A2676|nr:NHLP bacteriocin export ABC transporter permease/ATPase subunit [Cylindrospermum sp. FACHB-282]MBD2387106.1 NHLP bacteriocin export ABC transporter permease/ATPase subunit [Cylindrospermum sp. FACHB-282]